MKTNARVETNRVRRVPGRLLGLVVVTAVVLALWASRVPVASASLPSTNRWPTKANDLCRSASDHYFDLTAPDAVLRGRVTTNDEIRATGDYHRQVSRLYRTTTTGLKRLGTPFTQMRSLTTMINAIDAAATAEHQVFVESRAARSQAAADNPRFSKALTEADHKAGQAGEQARKLNLPECVILFDGGVADHQNASTGGNSDDQCGNIDPSFFNQDGAEYNPQLVPCSEPHTAEQYALTEYPASAATPFPGDNQLSRFGDDLCGARFKKYVGVDQAVSTLDYLSLTPYSDTWAGGDHSISCILFDANQQPLTGSMKDTSR